MKILLQLTLLFFLTGCVSSNNAKPDYRALTEQYFAIYTQRQDFEALMAMFAEDARLEDMIYGFHAKDKSAIRAFLNWHDQQFKLPEGRPSMVVQKQMVDGNKAAVEGYFTPFEYQGKAMGPWRFLIWLEFNDEGKIIREVDWINYTPRKDFLGGLDMNRETIPPIQM